MNDRIRTDIKHELSAVGAQARELDGLLAVVTKLELFGNNQHDVRQGRVRRSVLLTAMGFLSGSIIAGVLFIVAQGVLPGSVLYPLQTASDHAALLIYPEYRSALMMKQASQIKALTSKHAAEMLVMTTLRDYQATAGAYQISSAHYVVFAYCKQNLMQAQAQTSGNESKAIGRVVALLPDSN